MDRRIDNTQFLFQCYKKQKAKETNNVAANLSTNFPTPCFHVFHFLAHYNV
jgi:hypothetical protein